MGLCRLCLTESNDIIEIFGLEGRMKNILQIVSEFFWFQIVENDAISTVVCQECWHNTSTFQVFHNRVKLAQMRLVNCSELPAVQAKDEFDSVEMNKVLVDGVACKQELSDNQTDGVFDSNQHHSNVDPIKMPAEETRGESPSTSHTPTNVSTEADHDEDESDDDNDDANYSDDNQRQNANENHEDTTTDDDEDDAHPVRKRKTVTTKPERKGKRFERDAKIRSNCNLYCNICFDTFDTFLQLKKHYQREHDCIGYVLCCGRKFKKPGYLIEHIETHLNPDAFKCNICSARMKSSISLKLHMDKHMSVEDRPFACADCPNRYTSAKLLTNHRANKHSREEDKTFVCTVCDRKYLTAAKLDMHVKHMHDFVPEICDYCGKEFKTSGNLKTHRDSVHLSDDKTRKQCTICGKWLREQYLKKHIKRHSAEAMTCTVCGKTLQNKHSLGNHMRYVHGDRLHPCTVCEKTFTKPLSLREHMAVHTGKDLYTCGYCPKTFKSDANMCSHRKKCHFEEWTRDREKRNLHGA